MKGGSREAGERGMGKWKTLTPKFPPPPYKKEKIKIQVLNKSRFLRTCWTLGTLNKGNKSMENRL